MAATVEGAFVIVDRVSNTLDKIRRKAEQVDRAIEQLGDRLDQIGNNRQVRQLQQYERQVQNVGRAAGGMSRDFDRTGRSARNLRGRLAELGAALTGLSKLTKPALFAGIGVGIGVAVQAVSSLTAGVVALVPRIVDLTGVVGALPATFSGVALGIGAATLAFGGLGKAMGGNKDALRALTPEARTFLDTLKGFRPVVRDLRRSAQQGLFPGLDRSLANLRRGVPAIRRLLGGAGRQLGRQAEGFTEMLTSPGRLRDIAAVGGQGVEVLGRMGVGARNLAEALIDVAVAARPFTDWLTRTILGWTELARQSAATGRATGRLGNFFDRTRDSLEQFGRILSNLWGTFRNVGRASRDLGDSLYGDLERVTQGWEDWTASIRGQTEMRRWFDQAREPIRQLGGLVGDLGKAIVGIPMSGFADTVRTLRGYVPDLERGFGNLAQFGPDLARALGEIVRLLANMTGGGGVITVLLRAFTNVLDTINDILEAIPQIGTLVGAGVMFAALSRLNAAVMRIAASWGLVAANARTAQAAQMGGGVAGAAGAGAMAPGLLGRGRGRVGAFRQDYRMMRGHGATRREAARAAGWGPGGAFRGGGMGGVGMAAARFFGPLMLLGGGLGALGGTGGGGAGGLLRNILSGASGGIIPGQAQYAEGRGLEGYEAGQAALRRGGGAGGPVGTGERYLPGGVGPERTREMIERGYTPGARGMEQTTRSIAALEKSIARDKKRAADASGADRAYMLGIVRAEEERLAQLQLQKSQLREQKNLRDVRRGERFTGALDEAFRIRARAGGPELAMRQMTSRMLGTMKGMGQQGRNQIAQNMTTWAREQARQNPKLWGQVRSLEARIRRNFDRIGSHAVLVNGQIYSNATTAWRDIRSTMVTEAEKAALDTGKAFDKVYARAIGALQDMGFSKGEARNLIKGTTSGDRGERVRAGQLAGMPENPGAGGRTSTENRPDAGITPGGARGMRIPGSGTRDSVPLVHGLAAPGELVVNRHTEERVNRQLRAFGTSLGAEVAGEQRPHWQSLIRENAARGGRADGKAGAAVAGGSSGIVELGRQLQGQGYAVGEHPAFGGVQGGHTPGSYHYRGQAIDVNADTFPGGEGAALDRLHARLRGMPGVIELLWRVAGHFDHLHVAMAGGGGAAGNLGAFGAPGGAAAPRLRTPRGRTRGLPGALYDVAARAVTAGAQRRLDDAGGAAVPGAGLGAGVSGSNQEIARQMMLQMGWPESEWPALKALWTQESGFNHLIANKSSGAYGIPQALPATKMASAGPDWKTNPVTQVRWGLGYIKQRYGSPSKAWAFHGSHNWYEQGGRTPDWGGWHASGLDRTFRRPTLIGVGEGGAERVTVSPARGRGRGGGVVIRSVTIHNQREGDIERQLRAEVDRALGELASELDTQGAEDETELMS